MYFFVFMKENGLKNTLLNLNQFFVDVLIIFLFYSNQPIISKKFVTTLILVTQICPFHLKQKKTWYKMSFLDAKILRGNGKFVGTVYRKPTFNGVYANLRDFYHLHTNWYAIYLFYIVVLLYAHIGQNFIENLWP